MMDFNYYKKHHHENMVVSRLQIYEQNIKLLRKFGEEISRSVPDNLDWGMIRNELESMPEQQTVDNIRGILISLIKINQHRTFFYESLDEKQAQIFVRNCGETHQKFVALIEEIQSKLDEVPSY